LNQLWIAESFAPPQGGDCGCPWASKTPLGLLSLVIALVLLLVAWPRRGVSRAWLGDGGLAVTFPALVLVFLSLGCGLLVTAYAQ
jgi:hypothetical protein